MNDQLPIRVITQLLNLRTTLDSISQISWNFSVLNKRYTMDSITDADAAGLIEAYEKLVEDLKKIVEES